MQIIKFGGSILLDANGFSNMALTMKELIGEPAIIVVSAIGKTTSKLRKIADIASTGDLSRANQMSSELFEYHYHLASSLIGNTGLMKYRQIINEHQDLLKLLCRGLSITQELTSRILDRIQSIGEELILELSSLYILESGIEIEKVNSKELIVTDNNYGKAKPCKELTFVQSHRRLAEAIKSNKIVITQGYVALSESGEITTMGLESSNLTATLLAECFEVNKVVFRTDVPGICSADPKIFANAKLIKQLDYRTARMASKLGLKLIYPAIIDLAESKNIELIYKSGLNNSLDGTSIRRKNWNSEKNYNDEVSKLLLIKNVSERFGRRQLLDYTNDSTRSSGTNSLIMATGMNYNFIDFIAALTSPMINLIELNWMKDDDSQSGISNATFEINSNEPLNQILFKLLV